MFSFFNKKPQKAIEDIIWLTADAKYEGLIAMIREATQPLVVITFFPQTHEALRRWLTASNITVYEHLNMQTATMPAVCLLADKDVKPSSLYAYPRIVFAEHYPLRSREDAITEPLFAAQPKTVFTFLSALDEALLLHIGGENLGALMRRLAVSPDEAVSHRLISQSIAQAQEKLAQQVRNEKKADSAAAWLEGNI